MDNTTSIEDVMDALIVSLNLHEIPNFMRVNMKVIWIKSFRDNLVYNLGLLRRLTPAKLSKLQLPLLLEEEFEKMILSAPIRDPVVKFSDVVEDEKTSEHAETQLRIQERGARFQLLISDQQRELVRESWQKLLALKDPNDSTKDGIHYFARVFYPIFFQLNPSGQRLFDSANLNEQARALTNMLNWVIANIDNLPQLFPVLAQMGGRHEIYAVKENEYESFAQAVGETFKKIFESNITNESVEAWVATVLGISKLMREAGKTVKLGFRSELLRERSNGSWVKCWVTLTLDTIYVFKNDSFTSLKAQYSIRGVDSIVFPKNPPVPYCFELESMDPPFVLHVAADNTATFEDWIFEIDWRIQAIKHVYGTKADDLSEEDYMKNSVTQRVKKTNKKIVYRQRVKGEARVGHVGNEGGIVGVTMKEKEWVQKSWEMLLEEGIPKFVGEVYKRFFEVNPSGRRLFEEQSMEIQLQAMFKMLSMIIHTLDNTETLMETIYFLGGRHEIYGVESHDYVDFSNAVCDTIEVVLGKRYTTAMRESWYKLMMLVSKEMQAAGKKIKSNGINAVMFRKLRNGGQWKKSAVSASLDMFYVYQDEKMRKLRSTYPFHEVSNIEILDPHNHPNCPYQHGFSLLTTVHNEHLYFCCDSLEMQSKWINELSWRIQAVQRVYAEDNVSSDTQGPKLRKGDTKKPHRKLRPKSDHLPNK